EGHIEIVKFLVPTVADQTIRDDCCIKAAGSAGKIWPTLKSSIADQTKRDDCCIKAAEYAAIKGHIEIVKFLVPTVADQTKRDCMLHQSCRDLKSGAGDMATKFEIHIFLVADRCADKTKRDDLLHQSCPNLLAEMATLMKYRHSFYRCSPTDLLAQIVMADTKLKSIKFLKCPAGSAADMATIEIVKFLVPTVADQTKRDDCCIKAAESAAEMATLKSSSFSRGATLKSSSFSCRQSLNQTKRDDCLHQSCRICCSEGPTLKSSKFLVPHSRGPNKKEMIAGIKAAASLLHSLSRADSLVDLDKQKEMIAASKLPKSAMQTRATLKSSSFLVPTVADQTKRDDCRIKACRILLAEMVTLKSSINMATLKSSSFRAWHSRVTKQKEMILLHQSCRICSEWATWKSSIALTKQKEMIAASKLPNLLQTEGHIEIVKFLVPTVADPNKKDDCLHQSWPESAGNQGPHIEIVKFLVRPTVADQTKRDDCCIKAAESAAVKGHIEIVKFLVPTVADQTKRDDCCIKAAEYAAFLVPTVADQTKRDDCCIKAAKSAADEGHIEIVKFLVPTVADQTKRDDCASKLPNMLQMKGHIEIVKFLVPTVADQTKRDDCCIKAAASAAFNGHIEIVKFLVPTVATKTKRDDCRIKAAESAGRNGHFEIVKFLVRQSLTKQKEMIAASKLPNLLQTRATLKSSSFSCRQSRTKQKEMIAASKLPNLLAEMVTLKSSMRATFEIVKFLVPTVADQTKRDDCWHQSCQSG
uniref:ANK_REP_REGION domain-containing protein n=1 Tax=Macrostomum lignano TaxID=282301 RepID=A0A1I8FTC3_9PLAT